MPFIIIMIAISLSMDAFSLALAYGTLNFSLKEIKKISIIVGIFHFFTVSIDSFIVGISINSISNNIFLCSFTFMIVSFIFTYIGLVLGKKAYLRYNKKAVLFGSIVLILLGVKYLF